LWLEKKSHSAMWAEAEFSNNIHVAREESLGPVGRGGILRQQKTVTSMWLEKSHSAMWAEVEFSNNKNRDIHVAREESLGNVDRGGILKQQKL
jgi:hypothetical protein